MDLFLQQAMANKSSVLIQTTVILNPCDSDPEVIGYFMERANINTSMDAVLGEFLVVILRTG